MAYAHYGQFQLKTLINKFITLHALQPKLAQFSLGMKKSGLDNNNIANPQKHYQAAASFKNTSVAVIMEKNSAVFNLIDEKPMANPSYITLSTCISNITINNDN